MRARDLMTEDVAWIHLRATIAGATRLLANAPAGVLCLLVGRGDRVPFGIVTPVDVLRAALGSALEPGRVACPQAEGRMIVPCDLGEASIFEPLARAAASTPITAIMSSPVQCLEDDASAAEVMDLMIQRRIESVPVLHAGRVVGIIHRRALLRALDRLMNEEDRHALPEDRAHGRARGWEDERCGPDRPRAP